MCVYIGCQRLTLIRTHTPNLLFTHLHTHSPTHPPIHTPLVHIHSHSNSNLHTSPLVMAALDSDGAYSTLLGHPLPVHPYRCHADQGWGPKGRYGGRMHDNTIRTVTNIITRYLFLALEHSTHKKRISPQTQTNDNTVNPT